MKMEYVFRGRTIFTYNPETKEVTQNRIDGTPGFDICKFIDEDYKFLSEFFQTVYKHRTGLITDEELIDIEVY